MSKSLNRRDAIRLGAGATLAGLTGTIILRDGGAQPGQNQAESKAPPAATGSKAASKAAPKPEPKKDAIPMRLLGRTGQRVTIFGLGGASSKTPLSNGPHEEAIAIIERALALGVNYFDSAYTYGDGMSERAIGEVAKKRRKEMFLASKTDMRNYDGAMRELDGTLKRLQTDHLDLWQMHRASLHDRDTVPFFGSNGAHKAIEKAKSEKMIRFAGVSGHHSSEVLADWLRRYPFDTLLASINAADVHQNDSFIRNLLPVAAEKKTGVIAMKVPAYGALLNRDAGVTIRDAMHYSLSQRGVATCIIACDSVGMLEENVRAAKSIENVMDNEARTALEAKTASYWRRASFYRRWT